MDTASAMTFMDRPGDRVPSLAVYIFDMIMDVLNNIEATRGVPPRNSNIQYHQMTVALKDLGTNILNGSDGVPEQITMAPSCDLQVSACYAYIAAFMRQTRHVYAAPDPLVLEIANELATVSESIIAGQKGASLQQPPVDTRESVCSGDIASTSQSQRPGPGVLQSAGGSTSNMRSMTTVSDTSRMLTIGSGTDEVRYYEYPSVDDHSINKIKVMHPLGYADTESRQSDFLVKLHSVISRRFRGLFMDVNDIRDQAVMESMEVVEAELAGRGRPIPEWGLATNQQRHDRSQVGRSRSKFRQTPGSRAPSAYEQRPPSMYGTRPGSQIYARPQSQYGSRAQSFSASRPPQSGLGRQPLSMLGMPTSRAQSFRGTPASAMRIPKIRRSPPSAAGMGINAFDKIQTVGSGLVFSEYAKVPGGPEFKFKHPIAKDDIYDTMSVRTVTTLGLLIGELNSHILKSELEDAVTASKYAARKQSMQALNAWLEAEESDRDMVVAASIARKLDTPDAGAEVGKGKMPAATIERSALKVPGISGGSRSASKRSVSFKDNEGHEAVTYEAGPSPLAHPHTFSRTPSRMRSYQEKYGGLGSAASSRTSSYVRPPLPETASSGYIAAFPHAGRSQTLEAQLEAVRQDIAAMGTQEGSGKGDLPSAIDALNRDVMESLGAAALSSADHHSTMAGPTNDTVEKPETAREDDDKDPQRGTLNRESELGLTAAEQGEANLATEKNDNEDAFGASEEQKLFEVTEVDTADPEKGEGSVRPPALSSPRHLSEEEV